MSELGQDIIQGLHEAIKYKKGELTESDGIKIHHFPVVPEYVDVKKIRTKLELTQEEFSQFGFSVRSIQNWENAQRKPGRSVRALLTVIDKFPEAVFESLSDNTSTC